MRRVSSAAMRCTSRSTRRARRVMSSRLPMGVATTYKRPRRRPREHAILYIGGLGHVGPLAFTLVRPCACDLQKPCRTLRPTTWPGVMRCSPRRDLRRRARARRPARGLHSCGCRPAGTRPERLRPAARVDVARRGPGPIAPTTTRSPQCAGASARTRDGPDVGARSAAVRRTHRDRLASQAVFTYAPASERARRLLSKLRQVAGVLDAARANVRDPRASSSRPPPRRCAAW